MSKTTTLHWIGTGSGLNPLLGNTSFTISTGGDRVLLVDCGALIPPRLVEAGVIDSITDILITHMHADHIGGLETVAFYNHFALNRRGARRPKLFLATEKFEHILWEHALKAGMGLQHDEEGNPLWNTLDTYFDVHTGLSVEIPGLPKVEMFRTPHLAHMENYGLRIDETIYYSGDTTTLPPHDPEIIFHDCRFGPDDNGEIHIAYDKLRDRLPPEVRAKTYLVHLSTGEKEYDPVADGFAGFVMPGQKFQFES